MDTSIVVNSLSDTVILPPGTGEPQAGIPDDIPCIKNKKGYQVIDKRSVMNSRYLVTIVLILLIVPVAAFDLLEEKPKTQWGFRDFYKAAQDAGSQQFYYESSNKGNDPAKAAAFDQEALENYLKAEEIVAKDPDSSPDKWYFMNKIEDEKHDIYLRQGKTAEAEKAVAAMVVYNHKYEELTKDQGSGFDFPGCLVVTSTYGSPMAAEVQLVRDFRDQSIVKSYAGSRFMPGFNAWYYSFSPQVSGYINAHPVVRPAMRILLTPLIELVFLSQACYTLLSFNPEIATFAALVVGSVLYSLVYVFPFVFIAIVAAKRRGWKGADTISMKPVILAWAAIVILMTAGVVFSLDLLTTVSSGLLVISTIILVAGSLSFGLSKCIAGKTL